MRCALGEFPVISEYGYVDEPGRWDHWPSGFPLTWPNELQTNGTIVLDRGDILLPQKCYVAEPVRLTMRRGYCVAIEGGVDAALLRDYMASFNDPEAYAMSHIGWGLQPRARWSTLALYDRERTIGMDARAYKATPVLAGAEQRGRRQPQHGLPYRHPDPQLHGAARWRGHGHARRGAGRLRKGAGMSGDIDAYERQGFGADLQPQAPYGLLIVDLVNGFADPAVFGGGNIPQAIANTEQLLARRGHGAGRWRTAASCFPTTGRTATSSR